MWNTAPGFSAHSEGYYSQCHGDSAAYFHRDYGGGVSILQVPVVDLIKKPPPHALKYPMKVKKFGLRWDI